MPTAARTSSSRPPPRQPQLVKFEIAPRTLAVIGVAVACFWLAAELTIVLLVTGGALMLVGTLNPLIEALERRNVRRNFAIGLVFAVGIAVSVLLAFVTVPPLLAQARELLEHEAEIRHRVADYVQTMPFMQSFSDGLRDVRYDELIKESRAWLLDASIRAVEFVAYGFAAIFLAIYIMIDRDRLRGALFALVPRRHHVRTSRILINLEVIVGGYIRGQFITCVVIAVFLFVLLTICRVPNALALAVFAGVIDVLPYIGPLLTIVPTVAAAYTVGPWVAVTVFTALLLYEEFESRVLMPVVFGRALRLPSSVVFFALLAGGALGGIIGALLALPVASAILMLIEELRVELPGEAPARTAAAQRRKEEKEERQYEESVKDAPAVEAAAVAVEIARVQKEAENGKAPAAGR